MRLKIKGVVDWAVAGEKSLGRTLAFEPLLLSFSSTNDEVRILGPIVLTHPTRLVTPLKMQVFYRRTIRGQFVRHYRFRMNADVAK